MHANVLCLPPRHHSHIIIMIIVMVIIIDTRGVAAKLDAEVCK